MYYLIAPVFSIIVMHENCTIDAEIGMPRSWCYTHESFKMHGIVKESNTMQEQSVASQSWTSSYIYI